MRTHTQAFKDGIKAYGRQFEDKIYYNSQTYTGDHIFSVNYSVDTSLCKSIMQVLKIDTDISMNIGDTLDYGISIVGVTGSEIRFNNFIVNKIEEQKDKKSKLITCYDNMVKSMQDYESFYSSTSDSTFTTDKNYYELDNGKYKRYTGARTGNPSTLGLYQSDFPMTIRTYLGKICTRLGITFGSSSDTFTNYNKNVLSEHYIDVDGNPMGYTYRDVLDDIAEATGRFIRINNNNELIVKGFEVATGKNKFNSTSAFMGYINSSTSKISSSSGYRVAVNSIKPNTTYTISKIKNSYNYLGTSSTNASNVSLSNVTEMQDYTTSGGTTKVKATITTGANDKYIYIDLGPTSDYTNVRNSVQIEIGTEATDYESYRTDVIDEEFFNDKNVNIGEKVGPYNVVVLSRGDGSDNLVRPTPLPQTTYEFKIEGNPILDQTNREDFIDGIYNNINGLEFYANDFATKGIIYLEAGDKYNVSIDSTTYLCLMLSDNIKRTQGLTENIVTKEPKETVTDYKYASSTDKLEIQSRNAYFLADKANGTASMIVEGIGTNGQVTGASVIASINDDSSNLKLEADKIDINGVVSANNSFTIDTNGNMSCNNANITGGYLELTDDPDTYDDRLIIKKRNANEITTATSEYITITNDNATNNFTAMSLITGFSHSKGNSSQWKAGGINGARLSLTDFRNNTAKEISLDPYNGSIFAGDVRINGSSNSPFILDSSASESSMLYSQGGNGKYVVGYGTLGIDGYGVYSWETGNNVLTVDKYGNTKTMSIKTDDAGQVATQKLASGLQIKEAEVSVDSGIPNNGVILEYSKYSGWGGQLYIGDNAEQGMYYNGWSGGTRGTWKKVVLQDDYYNDTAGTSWQDMMKNKIDYCINNGFVYGTNGMCFFNGGWSGVNYGFGIFSKIGAMYQLVWYSTDGIYFCRKDGIYNTYLYRYVTFNVG